MTLIQKLYDYIAKTLFSSLINKGTGKLFQSSSRRIEITESKTVFINIKLEQDNRHQEAPNCSREGKVWAHAAPPRKSPGGSLLALALAFSLTSK